MKKIISLIIILSFLNSLCFAETIYFKDGKQLEAKIIERTDKWIKVDVLGVGLTYYLDEIDRINDEKISPSVQEIKPAVSIKASSPTELQSTGSSAASLYKEAGSKLTNVPEPQVVAPMLKDTVQYGWKSDTRIITLLQENQDAINIFRQATMLPSDGAVFGKRPEKLTLNSDIPKYINGVMLLRLLLLEASMNEAKNLYKSAEENYISAVRFMLHLTQERFKTAINFIGTTICLQISLQSLTQSIKNSAFSKEYYKNLLDNLLLIRSNYNSLENVFEGEAEAIKGTIRLLEEEAKKVAETGAGLREGDPLYPIASSLKLNKWKAQQFMNSGFFPELYERFDNNIDDLIGACILSSNKNDPKIYLNKMAEYSEYGKNKFQYLLYYLKQRFILGRRPEQMKAEIIASMLSNIVIPKIFELNTQFHIFYNRLNTLIAGVAIRIHQLDNGKLPDDLSQLVPGYLKEVPQDTYNNFQPLIYEKKDGGFVVYSFGPNRQDDKANTDILDLPKASQTTVGDIIFSY